MKDTFKTIGISVDNYKLDKFKSEITKLGYWNHKIESMTLDTSLIIIYLSLDYFERHKSIIHSLCIKLENEFKNSN